METLFLYKKSLRTWPPTAIRKAMWLGGVGTRRCSRGISQRPRLHSTAILSKRCLRFSVRPSPRLYLEGCIKLGQGQNARAREFFEIARPSMEAETIAHPNDALRHARLGLLYAYMGRKADAVREGKRAVQLTPVSKDAIDGHQWVCNLALIHARVGDTDQAIALTESLLRQPGCVSPLNEASMSLSELRLRWQWDPLRSDPRFQKILTAPEPPTVY